jgi:hypothetical protein
MKKTWEKRMRKLESILGARIRPPMVFRYGRVQHLPPDTGGERHIAIFKSEPTPLPNVQHCQFEERFGPAPHARDDLGFTVYLTKEGEDGNSS